MLVVVPILALIALASPAGTTGLDRPSVRYVEGGVDLGQEPAAPQARLAPGDTLTTAASGRAELALPDGSRLWLDRSSRLDLLELTPATLLRLRQGAIALELPEPLSAEANPPVPRIDTPAAYVFVLDRGRYLVSVAASGLTHAAVESGLAEVGGGRSSVLVHPGERTSVNPGDDPESPYLYNTAAGGDFGRFVDERREESDGDGDTAEDRYDLPAPVGRYRAQLDRHGRWRQIDGHGSGYVWCPEVASSWMPFVDGWWEPAPDGLTWVSNEPWGFVTYHYGSWDYRPSFGWYWIPGSVYSPAWVEFYQTGDYLAWRPHGRHHSRERDHDWRVARDRIARPFDPDRTVLIRRERLFDHRLRDARLPIDRIRLDEPPAAMGKGDVQDLIARLRDSLPGSTPRAPRSFRPPEVDRRPEARVDSWWRSEDRTAHAPGDTVSGTAPGTAPRSFRPPEVDRRPEARVDSWWRTQTRSEPSPRRSALPDAPPPATERAAPEERGRSFREFLKHRLGGERAAPAPRPSADPPAPAEASAPRASPPSDRHDDGHRGGVKSFVERVRERVGGKDEK